MPQDGFCVQIRLLVEDRVLQGGRVGDALRASADQSGHNQRLSNRRKERRDLPSNGTEAERVSYNARRRAKYAARDAASSRG